MVVNALLKDINQFHPEMVLDPSKLRQQRQRWRYRAVHEHETRSTKCSCIGFDGKNDTTLLQVSGCKRSLGEENYALVSFHVGEYVDHVVLESSKAQDVSRENLSVISYYDSTDSLQAVVCDGTNSNTSLHNGIIRKLEEVLCRPLQWLVCLLHFNELPLRKMLTFVDKAKSTGPATSTGIISSALQFGPKDLPIAAFKPIPGKVVDVNEVVKVDLSNDQLYFLKACLAVQSLLTDEADICFMKNNQTGTLNHAKWLTKANRILRFCMSKEVSSSALTRIVTFILNVYGPGWFMIKSFPSCQDGARNFFYVMQQCLLLDECHRKILLPVIENNKYFAHPENILLAAVGDEDLNVKIQAVARIIEARSQSMLHGVPRFNKDKILMNWPATSYFEVDWNRSDISPLRCYLIFPMMN